MKKVVIYCQEQDGLSKIVEEMKAFVLENKWILLGGAVDFVGSSEKLLELVEKIKEVDMILIHNNENIVDEFNYELLYEIARTENVKVIKYLEK